MQCYHEDMVEDDARDNSHLMSVEEWETVVQDAETPERHEPAKATLSRSSFPSVTGYVQSRWGGGQQSVRFGVLHDAETPLASGYALSIANYFSRTANETSAHFMVGPEATYQMRDTSMLAWHCGNGNRYSIGVEQTGYASLSRDQWLSPAGVAQIHRLASLMNEIKAAHGIGTHFMSDTDLARAWRGEIVGGWATHDQCRRVLGGTTHTDPTPNYPFDVLQQVLGNSPAPQPQPQPSRPPRLKWILPRGHYIGDIKGPANCHGGDPRYDSPEVIALIKNVQEWFIYRGAVPGVTNWQASNWDDGRFQRPYSTDAAIRWHARYYPHQPYPDQIWSDDYARLTS